MLNNYWNYLFFLNFNYFDYLLNYRLLNYSFNLNYNLLFISFNKYFLNLFVGFGNLLDQSYLSLNWNLNNLLLYCSSLNNLLNSLNNFNRFFDCIGNSNRNLFFNFNYLRKRYKVIDYLLNLHEFSYLNRDLFNHLHLF